MQKMRTSEKMRKVVEDRTIVYEKLLQEASSEEEKRDLIPVVTALKELLNDIDIFLDSLPYA